MNRDKTQQLRDGVREAYSAAAERPQDEHPFPVGRRFAESLGYPQNLLAGLPSASVDAFSGVSNVAVFADIPIGVTVLDLGCGAGLDSLIAARRVGPKGRVIGVDFSDTMLACARQAAAEAGADNVAFYQADAENLPIEGGSVNIALVNGIFNLNPKREAIFRELARVVRQGGAVYAAELILKEPLSPEIQESEANWFA
ncbi:MAG: methyltransferase domain-containing protein [Armatimonadetes bacterium]|nr:methyltransferase domain-containing protein [Armatimonadota bacterium]NIO97625.1 methyltransferase domain-containing protein [Armatimonadota bacterium]